MFMLGFAARLGRGTPQDCDCSALRGDTGLIVTVHPVVAPKVEYKLTDLGLSLGAAFCSVWLWSESDLDGVDSARRSFDKAALEAKQSKVER